MLALLAVLLSQLSSLTSPAIGSMSLLPGDIASTNAILDSVNEYLVLANSTEDAVNEVNGRIPCTGSS